MVISQGELRMAIQPADDTDSLRRRTARFDVGAYSGDGEADPAEVVPPAPHIATPRLLKHVLFECGVPTGAAPTDRERTHLASCPICRDRSRQIAAGLDRLERGLREVLPLPDRPSTAEFGVQPGARDAGR
jgi:hypothetical protein